MAHGHPDYWLYAVAQLPLPGIEQVPIIVEGNVILAGGATGNVCVYTPLAGFDTFLCGGIITCDAPGINRYYFRLGLFVHQDIYFDTVSILPFNPSALYRIPSGVQFRIVVTNDDTIAHTFTTFLPALRVTLVPDARLPGLTGLGVTVQGAGV